MRPIISIIVAMAKNRVIGKDNDMPWGRLPVDLKHFKNITNGNPVIMGRKTYESIGTPLPNRTNIVISRNKNLKIKNVIIVSSLEEAIKEAKLLKPKEIFIIGGGKIYNQSINLVDKLYITLIDLEIEGDTFFPEYSNFNLEISSKQVSKDINNKYNCVFLELEKQN
jgi:dihydrofolate reductase